jgi:hypothetical protein
MFCFPLIVSPLVAPVPTESRESVTYTGSAGSGRRHEVRKTACGA